MADRWLEQKTVDYSELPQVCPPVGVAAMNQARRLPGGGQPPNLSCWGRLAWHGNARPDMPRDPHRHVGGWS